MRIALVSTPWVAVPPRAYGGTEGMLDNLARALAAAGHEVLLYATGDSTCPVPKAWTYAEPVTPMGLVTSEIKHILGAYEVLQGFDVVHDHTMLGPLHAARFPALPLVTTSHNPFTPETRPIYRQIGERAALVAVSQDQRSRAGEVPIARVIHHGIHAADFPVGSGDGGFLLFLGRMSPDKGVHHAIEVALATDLPLTIAGKMREPDEHEYFRQRIEPALGPEIQYVGEVTRSERAELLATALALVNPLCWPEPFGLVMIEAMACGTPVIVSSAGAAPEIVDDGKTGFVCRSIGELVEGVRQLETLDRQECRRVVEERFSAERMAAEYADLYAEVVAAWPDHVRTKESASSRR